MSLKSVTTPLASTTSVRTSSRPRNRTGPSSETRLSRSTAASPIWSVTKNCYTTVFALSSQMPTTSSWTSSVSTLASKKVLRRGAALRAPQPTMAESGDHRTAMRVLLQATTIQGVEAWPTLCLSTPEAIPITRTPSSHL